MSTNCYIGVSDIPGVRYVYCHSDGYPDRVGEVLLKQHNSLEKARQIVNLGDLSYLHMGDVCAYHRDRNETWHENMPETAQSIEDYLRDATEDLGKGCPEYCYLFMGCKWRYWVVSELRDGGDSTKCMKTLQAA